MTDKEEKKEYDRKYREKNRVRIREYSKEWYLKNKGKKQEYKDKHRSKYIEFYKERAEKHKLEVLEHYGGSPPVCACCGEKHIEFLTIDHEGGGGTKHRVKVKRYGSAYYTWLIKNKYPIKLRVLCMNCNFATRFGRVCPHERER